MKLEERSNELKWKHIRRACAVLYDMFTAFIHSFVLRICFILVRVTVVKLHISLWLNLLQEQIEWGLKNKTNTVL